MKSPLPPQTSFDKNGPRYWRSLDDLLETPGFRDWIEREFPQGASEIQGMNRRHFLKIMAASFALAGFGMAGCRRPERKILPYAKQPERIIPGVPIYYSSSLPSAHDNLPLIIETHEARPTKIEGNPSYPAYGGATDIFAQASVLDLYDPDRATKSKQGSKTLSQSQLYDVIDKLRAHYQENQGKGLALLLRPSTSPTRYRLLTEWQRIYPESVMATYQPIAFDGSEKALEKLFGSRVRPFYHLAKANRILAFDSDFLHTEPGHLGYTKAFAQARRVANAKAAKRMNRLYAVESHFTLTGGMADHRLRLSSSEIPALVAQVAAAVFKATQGDSALISFLSQKGAGLDIDPQWIQACVEDLIAHKDQSLVISGTHLPEEVHLLTAAINTQLDAPKKTLSYLHVTQAEPTVEIEALRAATEKGAINTLIIVGGNPAYDAPTALDWANLSIPEIVRFGYHATDETSTIATTFVAATHYLESWGDGRTWDGTVVPVQPMILPLFEGLSELELIARLISAAETDPYANVRKTFSQLASVATSFDQWLAEGVLAKSAYQPITDSSKTVPLQPLLAKADLSPPALSEQRLELRFVPSNHVWDGQYSNNGWMQECPDAITKLTWDNAILVSPRLAKKLGILPKPIRMNRIGQSAIKANTIEKGREYAPVAELQLGKVRLKGPVHIPPGLANYTLVLPLGYGRSFGRIAKEVGFNVYPLRPHKAAYTHGATIRITDASYLLANTQEHWSMEGRAIVREANANDYYKYPNFAQKMGMEAHSPPIYGKDKGKPLSVKATQIPRGNSLYQTPTFTGPQQWGLSIDLNTCTGCNACVVACQSENNIPIVGKGQVARGREMHWIRLDRYYSSGPSAEGEIPTQDIPEDPQVTFQGMACQQCELAPCETVCPVNATVHDEQGLNVMAYNRCVGTRYCANNCPYKVRRFNFFDWNKRHIDHFYEGPLGPKGMPELHKMQKNPDVTVRMRGVMEKCTYCVQRIEAAKIDQKNKAKDSGAIKVPDGTIQTACQQVCPTDAIVFGDIADPQTEVSRLKASDRDYAVLGYLNIRPRTTYLAKLRNPNPAMPDYQDQPLSRMEYEAHGAASTH